MSENIELENLKNSLKSALHEVAVPLQEIDFTKENYNKLFPRSRIKTPIESVKLGANQFEKLEKKERQKILQAVHDTLATPDLIISEEKENVFGEKENSHLYAKSYIIDDKIHGIQSVAVSIDGENVSISTHERDINNIVNKIKKPDQLLYAAAEVRLLVEQHTELPQSVVNPNRDREYVASPSQNISQNQTLSTSDAKDKDGSKRKIYLSGKITGDEGFAEKFKAKEEELSARGDYVFNPALHPDMFTHGQFMQIDLLALSFCDSIYLMDNWRDSKGAKMEFEQAKILGLDVDFEKEPYILRAADGYYSSKSDEFDIFNSEDISADDMFATKEDAEQAKKRLLHKEAGHVTVLPASEVFGKKKQKEISLKQQEALLVKILSKETINSIVEQSNNDNSYMKAPNGDATTLSEPEWIFLHSDKGNEQLKNWEYLAAFKYATEGEAVKKLTGNEFQKLNGESIVDRVLTYYTDIFSNVTERIEIGNVVLDKKGIRDSLSHGLGKEKAAAFAAVPEVIKKGIIFDRQKNRNHDTYVLIAPVEIAGKKYAEEVVLRRDSKSSKFYLHEVEIKEKLQELFKTPTKGCSPKSYLIISQHIDKIKNCPINISNSFEPAQKDVLQAMEYSIEKEMLLSDDASIAQKENGNASHKIVLNKSHYDKKERYAPEAFIREIQEAIASNPYMSDAGIIQTAKDILFEHDIALGLEDNRRLNGTESTDYTAKERDEINEALIALGGTQNIVDILKNTDPSDVKPLMDSRKQFEEQLDKEGIKHSTNKDGSYNLDCGSVIFDTTNIIFYNPKYPSKQSLEPQSYIDMKAPERTSELVQRTVQNIAKFRNQQVEKKTAKKQQRGEVERERT